MSSISISRIPYAEPVVRTGAGLVNMYRRLSLQGKIGVWIMGALSVIAILAPLIAPYDPAHQNYEAFQQAPSLAHPFGTDHIGRDVLSRIIFGARISLAVASLAVLWSTVVGAIAGAVAGYRGGIVDDIIMRFADAILAFPAIVLAIALVAVMPASIPTLAFAIGFSYTAKYARLVRSEVLTVKEEPFIEAARGLGMSDRKILSQEVLPNSFQPVIVQMTFHFPLAVLAEAGLSFLGLGVSSPTATWGRMIQLNQQYMPEVWWPIVAPGLAIFITVLAFNLIGDSVQDEWDPYTETDL